MNICDHCKNAHMCIFDEKVERSKCAFYEPTLEEPFADIFRKAKEIIKEEIKDYRPVVMSGDDITVIIENAIRIWLANGDEIIYMKKKGDIRNG